MKTQYDELVEALEELLTQWDVCQTEWAELNEQAERKGFAYEDGKAREETYQFCAAQLRHRIAQFSK